AYQRAGSGHIAMAICGDGATSNGRWHEALNTSAVFRLPVVWVVNNNQFAYSTPNAKEFAVPTIAERGAAYGMPGVRVDGTDVLEVYGVAREAVERARRGDGPTLIEAVSLRWRGHAGHDPAKYVPRELLEHYMLSKDPVKNFEQYLKDQRIVTDEDVAEIQARVEREFEEGHEYALASPFPEPGDVIKGWWVEDGYWVGEPGRAGGTAAMEGLRPVAEFQYADFMSSGFDEITTVLSRYHYRAGVPLPVVLRGPSGGGVRASSFHSINPEPWYAYAGGIKIMCPAFPSDA